MVSCVLDGWIGTGDPTHSEKLVDELNFGVSKGAAAPRTEATGYERPHSGHTLTSQRAEKYRSLAGREQHHSLHVPLVKFDTGLVMRAWTHSGCSKRWLHRVSAASRGTRYGLAVSMAGSRRNVEASRPCGRRPRSRRREQAEIELLTRVSVWPLVGPGSWATDLRVAISSGESEFHALTFCAARLIFRLVSPAWKDRQPARISQQQWCIANREGIGKLKHLQVRILWLQQGTGGGTGEGR